MYKSVITSSVQQESSDSLESKYTVAEILSSMTNGEPPITPVSFSSGIAPTYPISSASMLTPTTLASLEQTFSDLTNQPADQGISTESGFVIPVVNPIVIDPSNTTAMGIKREYEPSWDDDLSSCSSTDPADWNGVSNKRQRMDNTGSLVPKIDPNTYLVANSRRPTGPRKERDFNSMSGEELNRREQRRDRNKVAAAKCRQRRVDQTNTLINETENLEEEKAQLETEISSLQQQKEQLQFLLDAHKPICKHNTHQPTTVKQEHHANSMAASYPSPILGHAQQVTMAMTTPRPNSLPLRTTQAHNVTATTATGVPITTPSNGVFGNLSLDTMLEGHTGLTPLTGAPSCGSQVQLQRNSSDSSPEMSSPNTTLISL